MNLDEEYDTIVQLFHNQQNRNTVAEYVVRSRVKGKNYSVSFNDTLQLEFNNKKQTITLKPFAHQKTVITYANLQKILKKDSKNRPDLYYYPDEYTIKKAIYDDQGNYLRPGTVMIERRKTK